MGSFEGSIVLGPWGGQGGSRWRYKPSGGITEISIHQSGAITSISFKDSDGHISGIFGGLDPDDKGDEQMIYIDWPSEYLKSVSGTHGEYKGLSAITSLSFNTNLNTYGPFGVYEDEGEPFNVPMEDCVIVGFHGSAGYYLDSIGIYVEPDNSHGSISFGQWGEMGGDPFSFRVGSWIKKIKIEEADIIKSISFKDAHGNKYGTFGGKSPDDDGDKKTIKIDGPSEYLTSMSGTYGMYNEFMVVTSLSFTTNYTTHGPFGSPSDTYFSIPIQGSEINGFHGREGYYIDAIGIYAKPKEMQGLISIGPWGGPGGDPWSFITNRGINEITIYVGENIKSISFKDITGLDSGTYGGKDENDIGESYTIYIDAPSEHLVSLSGTYGYYNGDMLTITSLSFTTNYTTHGPYGTTSDDHFSIPINYHTIVGFHGSAGYYLDSIGIYVKAKTTL